MIDIFGRPARPVTMVEAVEIIHAELEAAQDAYQDAMEKGQAERARVCEEAIDWYSDALGDDMTVFAEVCATFRLRIIAGRPRPKPGHWDGDDRWVCGECGTARDHTREDCPWCNRED